ncbi:MAG TPA: phosphatidate cytidylyltransferase [Anaerolineales bacterium]|nr:phosphatidate cytidylyltransferase [Anaerolineales bacterium]
MLPDRLVVALLLLPIGLGLIAYGGVPLLLIISVLVVLAALEYADLFARTGLAPSRWLVAGGALALIVARHLFGFDHVGLILTLIMLIAVAWYLRAYERGSARAATDFAVTLAGIIYLGWFGAYFMSLRALPGGEWWLLVALTGVWFGDAAAFSIGRRFGRHPMSLRLSPRKTWEGYVASIVGGGLGSGLLSLLWQIAAPPGSGVGLVSGLVIGSLLGALGTLGDLAVSMLKREVGVKDSGTLLPGHGGALDRIDSWIVGAAIGYYLVVGLAPLLH